MNETNMKKIETFAQVAIELFPEIAETGSITAKQVRTAATKANVGWPYHITHSGRNLARGVYAFELPSVVSFSIPEQPQETDEELDLRIEETYDNVDKLVRAVASNAVNSLIIAGAPGLGKSYEVNKTLKEVNDGEYGYVFHRGYLKATHLFRMLWENRHPGQTVVLDDTDSIFSDETALNILKAALELKNVRRIGWGSEKEFLDEDGEVIPRYFNFEGNVIFLTNLAFSDIASGTGKNAPHLAALESRSLVIDLKIKTKRELMAKIKQTVRQGMLRSRGLTASDEQEVLQFMEDNIDRLKDLSLRSAEKLAVLLTVDRGGWKSMAQTTCLR